MYICGMFLENGNHIVILLIKHDAFAPYVHLENGKYFVYKREGNSKAVIAYSELKKMMTRSISTEKEIDTFRRERLAYWNNNTFLIEYNCVTHSETYVDYSNSQYLMMHIIPDTFVDSDYNKTMFVIGQKGKAYYPVFQPFMCCRFAFPSVDGIRFTDMKSQSEARLFNNGVAEMFYPLHDDLYIDDTTFRNGFFPWSNVWTRISNSILGYAECVADKLETTRVFVCVSNLK